MTKLGQVTTIRNAAMVLNFIFDSVVTHDTVMRALHQLRPLVSQASRQDEQLPRQRQVPENLTIEGDAFMIRLKQAKQASIYQHEVHHYRIYERHENEIVRCHDFLETGSLEQLKARVQKFIEHHYRLAGQTIFLASDAGPGYAPERMLNLVPIGAKGAYFLDRYHCLQKIETTLGKDNELTPLAIQAVQKHD